MTDTLLLDFAKEFGEGKICRLGSNEKMMNLKVRSSGSLALDCALGGGYPHGMLVELRGFEKSGKTTLLNLAIAEAQRNEPDKECAIIDLEYTYNPEWAKTLGVDVDRLFFSQPDTYAEKVFDMVEYLIKTNRFSIIGIDSVAGLIPKEEFLEEDWEKETRVGGASKVITKAMRKLVYSGILKQSGTTIIAINQLRDKIGGFSMYGTPTETPGGRALKHTANQQLDVSVGDQFKKGVGDNTVVFGQEIKVKVSKNKIAPPHRRATLNLLYDSGLDRLMELVEVAKAIGVLRGTSWLTFCNPITGEVFMDGGKEIKFNGIAKTVEALKEDLTKDGALYTQMFTVVNEVLRGGL